MAALTTVVDGNVKFREGKKWKNRWCVLKKPSPVADHLQLVLYKDVSEASKSGGKPKAVYTLDSYFGLEAEISVDREQHVMAIICLKNVFLMAFELRESMIRFEIKIRQSLGEEHQFPVKVVRAPSSSKLPKDQVCLVIHDTRFCLTAQTPPKIFMSWSVENLRRFVARDNKFIFEGGTTCGKGSGLFALQSDQADDIADIINLASSGKMSNCHRKFKNRRSQIELTSHLISPLPSQSLSSSQPHHHYNHHSQLRQPNHGSKAALQGGLPATLNCCIENQTGSAESEDWSWYKRHSVSVTDHRRISALRDKNNTETRDQIIMEIYDTPPNHAECTPVNPTYDHPRFESHRSKPELSHANVQQEAISTYSNNDRVDGLYKRIEYTGNNPTSHDNVLPNTAGIHVHENCGPNLNGISIELDKDFNDSSSCNNTMEKLRRQEYDLQREMVLLDEMLQSCTAETKSLSCSAGNRVLGLGKIPTKDGIVETTQLSATDCSFDGKKHDAYVGLYDELPMTHVTAETKRNTQDFSCPENDIPSLSVSSQNLEEIISGNISIVKPNVMSQIGSYEKKKRPVLARLNTSLPEGLPLSPLFHAKLKSIPPDSSLNAPLPYVNLSGYDDEATNHVHLPGSADCIPVTRGSSCQSLNTSQQAGNVKPASWRGHVGSVTSLPAAASSLTNLHQHRTDEPHKRIQGKQFLESGLRPRNNQEHFKLKQSIEGPSFANDCKSSRQEVLVVKMDPDVSCTESSIFSSLRSLSFDTGESSKFKPEIVNLLTVDSSHPIEHETKREEIYENISALRMMKEDTPPPPLPPKGPALLKKLKEASVSSSKSESRSATPSMSSPPTQPRQNLSSAAVNRHFGYDNTPTKDIPTRTQACKKETNEPCSNYLEMGSPEMSHRHTKTVPKMSTRMSEQSKVNKTMTRFPKVRDDYMDMGVVDLPMTEPHYEEEDKIYLDADETFKKCELYISERQMAEKKREKQIPPLVPVGKRESTYVEMAKIPTPRKSMVLQNLETLQAYVTQKLGSERTTQPNQTDTASTDNKIVTDKIATTSACTSNAAAAAHPPLPKRSFKVRHNSDSGPSRRESANIDSPSFSNGKPGKSPMRVYTKVKGPDSSQPSSPNSEPPAPFTNLKEFTKRMGDGKSTYVNTTVNADDILVAHDFVPLPEPAKEGFLARLKRRSSKDRGIPATEKSSGNGKNRISVLERSMSEHESPKCLRKDDKNAKIKLGRRRSSSFPNRLSYQETSNDSSPSVTANHKAESSSSFSSESSKSKPSSYRKDKSESSSSVHDFSDDSDVSPLLKHGRTGVGSGTVLYVQQNQPLGKKELFASQSTSCLTSLSLDSSKTDDEKMIEMFHNRHPLHKANSMSDSVHEEHYANTSVDSKEKTYLNTSVDGVLKSGTRVPELPPVGGSNVEEYCDMNAPPKPPINLNVNTGLESSTPPALPPKTRSYQALLSPVLESIPPLPIGARGSCQNSVDEVTTLLPIWQSRDEDEDSLSDQYVELKGADGDEEEPSFSLVIASNHLKAGRQSNPSSSSSSDPKEMNLQCAEYTTISLPITANLTNGDDSNEVGQETLLPKSSPTLIASSITVEQNSISSEGNEAAEDFNSPAKSVLRPRAGREYVVIKRIPTPDSSCHGSLPSHSPCLSQAFSYDHHPDHHHHNHPHHHHPHHQHQSTKCHHSHPVSSCTSLSICSRLSAQITPQRSPSLSGTIGTAQSQVSLVHEPWERDIILQIPHPSHCPKHSAHILMSTLTSSPSPSPKTPLIGSTIYPSPKPKKTSGNFYPHSALPEANNFFFPGDITYKSSTLLPRCSRRSSESQPIYVNQQFVDIHYSQNQNHSCGSRTVSTSSSLSNPSPFHTHMYPSQCYPHESLPNPKHNSESKSNSLGRNMRMRSRHSESEVILSRDNKFSKSFSLPSSRHRPTLTLPANVQRSHSDSKRADNIQPLQTISHNHFHRKEFDKFAKSSIIARRRLKHAELTPKSFAMEDGKHSPTTPSVSTSEPSLFLQTPSMTRSSGYKNIDRLNMTSAIDSPLGSAVAPISPIPPLSLTETSSYESQICSDHQHNEHLVTNSPPPLPIRQRFMSTPSSASPPLTPFMLSSDVSDSPPPYNAPPPPGCRSELVLTSSSSEDEQELNYIEIDMSSKPREPKQPPLPIPSSRRSKRISQQKKLAKLRYAEIDHTATKALKHTGEEHAQNRRSTNVGPKSGSSLSRMNSAPMSKTHTPLAIRERKHSTGSVESF